MIVSGMIVFASVAVKMRYFHINWLGIDQSRTQ